LSEDQAKETVKHYKKVLKDSKAKILHEENWGMRKLAYPIQHKSTGFYHLFEMEIDGSAIEKLETTYKRDEKILRFLTTKMDKHAIKFAEKVRAAKGAEKVATEETEKA
jgi:small subunit ribosomal protein S6